MGEIFNCFIVPSKLVRYVNDSIKHLSCCSKGGPMGGEGGENVRESASGDQEFPSISPIKYSSENKISTDYKVVNVGK